MPCRHCECQGFDTGSNRREFGKGAGRHLAIIQASGICRFRSLACRPYTHRGSTFGRVQVTDDPKKVWPSGLTIAEAEEVHKQLILGTRVFGGMA